MAEVTLVEVRRLTGPNLWLDAPGAVLDVACAVPGDVREALLARLDAYRQALDGHDLWRDALGATSAAPWSDGTGLTLAVEAPVDRLYAACAVLEHVLEDVQAGVGADGDVSGEVVARLVAEAEDERDERLLAVLAAAEAHRVAGVWDDDELSVGLGQGSLTWDRGHVPAPDHVPWSDVHDVPVALVTGTNGKSTTVRMLAAILRAAGLRPGNSSTDGIVVDGALVERGDWSGPGGGRTVGRDHRVGAMVLECARGGLLRRGLPLQRADVAVVTNIAADHLGEYGIQSVEDLAHAKLVLAKAVRDTGVLVTNAEDALLAATAPSGPRTWWFAVDPDAPRLAAAVREGSTGLTVVDGRLVRRTLDGDRPLVAVDDVPATYGGAARHNAANALAAAGAAAALGVADDAIAAGLRAFIPDVETNPGRANRYVVDGVTVIVDFAHNEHAVEAMAYLASSLGDGRTLVLFSQAGDRSDDLLDDLAGAVHAARPDAYVVAEVEGYLRGRAPMEVPTRLAAALRARGVDDGAIVRTADAVEGTRWALDWAEPGDVLLLLVLQHRTEVVQLLRERGATAG